MLFTEIQEFVRQRPFEPFRILTSDGHGYDVPHPEFAMVGLSATVIGIPTVVDGKTTVGGFLKLVNEQIVSCVPFALLDQVKSPSTA